MAKTHCKCGKSFFCQCFLTQVDIFKLVYWGMGYPSKNSKRDMEFLGVLKKEHVVIPEVNYKRSAISRSIQEKLMWNF